MLQTFEFVCSENIREKEYLRLEDQNYIGRDENGSQIKSRERENVFCSFPS